jgi:pimeloyl-ACP methyl ester carboxylesterase
VSYSTDEGHRGVPLHVETFGKGEPVTVFAGGLGATISETRRLGSGVAGTKVFFDFRGHGRSGEPADGDWSYGALARDLRAVADGSGATRAVGVSMGAAALLRVLAETPDRFARCVFFLPAILDRPREDVSASALVDADVPAALRDRPDVSAYAEARNARLTDRGVAGLVDALTTTAPVADRAVLAAVRAECLVIGQEGDATHPASVARDLAAALPDAGLHVFDAPGGLWTHGEKVRLLVPFFLDSDRG